MLNLLGNLDARVSLWLYKQGLRLPRVLLQVLEYSGDGLFWIPVVVAIWLAPVPLPKGIQIFVFNLFTAFIFDLMLIGIIKSIVRRDRPVYNKGMYIVVSADHWSFPSGHSSRALLIATFFWLYQSLWQEMAFDLLERMSYKQPHLVVGSYKFPQVLVILIGCLTVLWAISTAGSRVLLGRHFACDVMVGSIIGVSEALVVHYLICEKLPASFILSASHKRSYVYDSILGYIYA